MGTKLFPGTSCTHGARDKEGAPSAGMRTWWGLEVTTSWEAACGKHPKLREQHARSAHHEGHSLEAASSDSGHGRTGQ